MRLPTNNPVTFPYGATSPPYTASNPHAGTDYGYRLLTPFVYAPEKIRITSTGHDLACGNKINATGQSGRKYRFCHLHSNYVKTGSTYVEGTRLAKIGDTGFTFGKHLHFVMWVNGNRVDPDKTIRSIMAGELTTEMQDVLYRSELGRAATSTSRVWVGKAGHGFSEERKRIRATDEWKKRAAGIKKDKVNHRYDGVNEHLPTGMR